MDYTHTHRVQLRNVLHVSILESMPISDNELYVFSYDIIRGVTLEFITNRWLNLVVCYYVYSILLLLFFRIILLITLTILFPRLNIPLLENSELKYVPQTKEEDERKTISWRDIALHHML